MSAPKNRKRLTASAFAPTSPYQLELDPSRSTPSLPCHPHLLIPGHSPKVPLAPMYNPHRSPQYIVSTPSPANATNTVSPPAPPIPSIPGNTMVPLGVPSSSAVPAMYERILPKHPSGTSTSGTSSPYPPPYHHASLTPTNSSADQREKARRVSHSAIERRRRERMNDKIMQLKDIIPTCADQDNLHKLTILQSAIDYIQYLKNQVDSAEPALGDDHRGKPPLKHVAPSPPCSTSSDSSSLVSTAPSLDAVSITTKSHQMTLDNLLS
ncbi:hypothetical protein [Absidia glauca]|uniref:BHLH domain-containing protein n=1 Tax=Absidia glauca TaxID=4829 RepID=A0A163KR21_ABSGL|nr:hypothetical protein [Absidia glauca]